MIAPACDVDPTGEAAIDFRPSTGGGGTGGMYLNTNAIGTHPLSELDLQGLEHDGVRLASVKLKRPNNVWLTLDSVWSEQGALRGKRGTTTFAGVDFVGSLWELHFADGDGDGYDEDENDEDDGDEDGDGDGEDVRFMWVDSMTTPASGAPRYVFKHTDLGQTRSVCAADSAGSTAAVVLADLTVDDLTGSLATRAHTLYLGCVSGAVGKAVTWGYAPWQVGAEGLEVASRVVRADYCGDGRSWTQAGAALQLRDAWAINDFADWTDPTEALWSDAGALCLGRPRDAGLAAITVTCGGSPIPTCAPSATLGTYPDAVIWSRVFLP